MPEYGTGQGSCDPAKKQLELYQHFGLGEKRVIYEGPTSDLMGGKGFYGKGN